MDFPGRIRQCIPTAVLDLWGKGAFFALMVEQSGAMWGTVADVGVDVTSGC